MTQCCLPIARGPKPPPICGWRRARSTTCVSVAPALSMANTVAVSAIIVMISWLGLTARVAAQRQRKHPRAAAMIEATPATRYKTRVQLATISTLSILLVLAAELPRRPFLIWNATASVPVGLYRLSHVAAERGDIVAVRLPRSIAELASARGYLAHNSLLLKPLGATAGDHVCRRGPLIFINGALRVVALATDSRGQRLPTWRDCVTLNPDEAFVLGTRRDSYDSRYFGPIQTSQILGRALPVWTTQD
jgi:conjugative transfer signal peptidase TraF